MSAWAKAMVALHDERIKGVALLAVIRKLESERPSMALAWALGFLTGQMCMALIFRLATG